MKWNGIVIKTGITIVGIILLVLLPLIFIVDQIFSDFYYKNIQERIDSLASKYAASVNRLSDPRDLVLFNQLAELTETEIFIINADNIVIASSGLAEFTVGEEVREDWLGRGLFNKHEYKDPTTNIPYLVAGSPIQNNNELVGGVFVLTAVEEIHKSIQLVRQSILNSVLITILLALGYAFFMAKKMAKPLLEMEAATRKIAKGDLQQRVAVRSTDEIGQLAKAINDLALEIHEYRVNHREFFANVSHELRTPITNIEGYVQVLKNKMYETEEEKEQYMAVIENESKRLLRLIEDLFALSKMEEGRLVFHMEHIDITEVVENVVHKEKLKATEKNIKLSLHIDYPIPLVYADGQRMEQVVFNLVENAVRYTNEGEITIRVRADKKMAYIAVSDTGIGIPEKDIPHIFDRFYRVEKSRSRESGGTGLGLSIVKQLVEGQHGTIRVKSVLNKGTTFEVALPISEEKG